MNTITWILIFLGAAGILIYNRASLSVWAVSFIPLLVLQLRFSTTPWPTLSLEWIIFVAILACLGITFLRQWLITRPLLAVSQKKVLRMSDTEREALEAGTVTWEGSLFQGNPDWANLLSLPPGQLSAEEEAFLAGECEELCKMINDWDITHNRADLPPEVWQFLKEKGFFGLVIPKKYGGKEFSAFAHSAVLTKLYGYNVTLGSTVAVPNALGPAELILHYGTAEQKEHYLMRLAKGEEIPCFALTNPEAGSDASSIPDYGIVCRGKFIGKDTLSIRLNWEKRYITLAPVATVIALAFRLYDPEHLLSSKTDLGITCALIPFNRPGITIGRRHLPLNVPFQNGPIFGKDVIIPLDWIIGGVGKIGQGWQMIVESLAAGRAISLPSGALGAMKSFAQASGAYARIRKQFSHPIGHFEGIQNPLCHIAVLTAMADAVVKFTVAAIDRGEKPVLPAAILKYHVTEWSRQAILHAMDIHGGKGICLGPRNYLAGLYQSSPISITVEGANILTRSLIIFGQGAVRCHPYILAELQAANELDPKAKLEKFDSAIMGHLAYTVSNVVRTFWLSLTGARLVMTPASPVRRYFQRLTHYSSAFALIADFSMLALGGDLKRKENLSARLGDVLSMLYVASAVLKQYAEQDYPPESRPLIDWMCTSLLFTIQQQLSAILRNFPKRGMARCLRFLIFPFGMHQAEPSDALSKQVAELLLAPNDTRQRLTEGIYSTPNPNNPVALMEQALQKVIQAEFAEQRLEKAIRAKKIVGITLEEQVHLAVTTGLLAPEDGDLIMAAHAARREVIAVDDFSPEELARVKQKNTAEVPVE